MRSKHAFRGIPPLALKPHMSLSSHTCAQIAHFSYSHTCAQITHFVVSAHLRSNHTFRCIRIIALKPHISPYSHTCDQTTHCVCVTFIIFSLYSHTRAKLTYVYVCGDKIIRYVRSHICAQLTPRVVFSHLRSNHRFRRIRTLAINSHILLYSQRCAGAFAKAWHPLSA